jgi:hypothetical protein
MSQTIAAHRQLMKVKLAACRTVSERIAVLTAGLKTLQELESGVKEAADADALPESSFSEMHQYRIETEVELAKLQSAPKD